MKITICHQQLEMFDLLLSMFTVWDYYLKYADVATSVIQSGNLDILGIFLNHYPACFREQDPMNQEMAMSTALHWHYNGNRVKKENVIRFMLDVGIGPDSTWPRHKPMIFAVKYCEPEIIIMLENAGASMSRADAMVEADDLKLPRLRWLIEEGGVDVNHSLADGRRVLHTMIFRRNLKKISYLLGQGADPNVCCPSYKDEHGFPQSQKHTTMDIALNDADWVSAHSNLYQSNDHLQQSLEIMRLLQRH